MTVKVYGNFEGGIEAIQRWSAICRVWPWTLTYQKSFCAFLARVKTYTHTKN